MSESSGPQDPIRQAKLEQLLAEYVYSVESGRPLDRQWLLATILIGLTIRLLRPQRGRSAVTSH